MEYDFSRSYCKAANNPLEQAVETPNLYGSWQVKTMDSLKTHDLAQLLGLYSPWIIKDIELASDSNSLTFIVEKQPEKNIFGFLTGNKKGPQVIHRWQHIRFGHVNTYIEATLSQAELADMSANRPPAFLGEEHKTITRELADTIHIAFSRNLSPEMISGLLGIGLGLVEGEVHDMTGGQQTPHNIALLPLESNPIWRQVLTDQLKLTTRLLPLKLLLSRLKLEVHKNPNSGQVMQKSVAELRTFFIRHAQQLQQEFKILGASENQPNAHTNPNGGARNRLVLPGTKNPLWHQLLTGELDLDSQNMALRLSLARNSRSYLLTYDEYERLDIVRNLQLFFKHNARNLIPELRLLTELLGQQQDQTRIQLPPVTDNIWKNLLLDDGLLNSEKINYRLLLSRLKSSYRRNHDPLNIEQLHSFFIHNAQTMSDEISLINRLAANQ